MERITKKQLESKVEIVNSQMTMAGSSRRYEIEYRNGNCALDGYTNGVCMSNVVCGTKKEVSATLYAMATALADVRWIRA